MKTKQIVTDVFIVCDLSGSMMGAREAKLRLVVQKYIETLADAEADGSQKFSVTLMPFSFQVELGFRSSTARDFPLSEVLGLTTHRRFMGGGTALRDAIGKALEQTRVGTPALIQVFTDGEECSSSLYSTNRLAGAIAASERTGNVTVAMAGPTSACNSLSAIGMPPGNFRAWDGTVQEMAKMEAATVQSVTQYTQQRAKGATRSTAFYVDPSTLNTSAVRGYAKKVDPAEIKVVTKTMAGRSIADFYGSKFQAGNHYYQLIKTETIQEDKDLVVHIKDANEYRVGSRTVRALLGLPELGKIRVRPATSGSNYEVFVQTKSVNRKLVEGQKMLSLE